MTRTSTPVDAPEATPTPTPPARRRRITPGRVAAAAVILGLLGMWGYVLGLRWTGEREIDRWDVVDDDAWVQAAAAACAPSAALLDGVDEPGGTAAEQADALDATTALLAERLAALEAIPPTASTDPDDPVAIAGWLADWRLHVDERTEYARELRAGLDGVFNGTATDDGESITERMDAFTERNEIPGCATVDDLRTQ